MNNARLVTIEVKPLQAGWSVECGRNFAPQVFGRGGEAERCAVRLAAAFTKAGLFSRVMIHDALGAVVGVLEASPLERSVGRWRRTIH